MSATGDEFNTHDTSVVYRPEEPSILRRALPWLVALAAAVGLFFLVRALGQAMSTVTPSFSILKIPNGWVTALLWLLGAVGVLFLTSAIGTALGSRSGRKANYWGVFGTQFTHVFIWLVVLAAIYPLFFVIVASLDPRNSLYQLFQPDKGNVFVRSGIWPNFANSSLENYTKLFDGVVVPGWQLVLLVIAAAAILTLLVIAGLTRLRGGDNKGLARPQSWAMRVLVVVLALIVIFMTPAQFTGQGNESKFLLSIRNTFLVAGMTGLLGLLLSTTAGYAMARLRFPGRFQTLLFFIFVQMFPVFLALVAIKFLLFALGLDNTFTGLILAYSGGAIAFNTWIYKGYVESLPESLEEAALVDGGTRWQAFWRVVLPLSGSMLVFIFLNQFIGTYSEYILSSRVLTGAENWTVGVMLQSFTEGQFSTKWGIFAAAAVVGALPIVALFYGFQQFFVSGAIAGGVKE